MCGSNVEIIAISEFFGPLLSFCFVSEGQISETLTVTVGLKVVTKTNISRIFW
jgi:hypothetical protein